VKKAAPLSPRTLSIDIGGTHLKAAVLDARGRLVSEAVKIDTPRPATPAAVSRTLRKLLREVPGFERAAVGFPGVVVDGRVLNEPPNLHPSWLGVDLERRMRADIGRPVRVANDADVQGLGVIEGRGVEMVITLGTGVGSALFIDGRLVPNLELGHHPFRHGMTYEQQLGGRPLHRIGRTRWNKRLRLAVETLWRAFNPRRLYLGGGNSRLVRRPLPRGVVVVSNLAGVLGGIRLWENEPRDRARGPRRGGRRATSSARAASRT
jgi:polyphosphate glucokinase